MRMAFWELSLAGRCGRSRRPALPSDLVAVPRFRSTAEERTADGETVRIFGNVWHTQEVTPGRRRICGCGRRLPYGRECRG